MVTKKVKKKKKKKKKVEETNSLELVEALKDFTPKQAAFYLKWLETGNATKAAMGIYGCKDKASAATIGWENLRKLDNPMQRYAEAHGLDMPFAVKKLKEGLEATKTTSAAVVLIKKGKRVVTKQQESIEVADYEERGEWWDRLMKLMGWVKETPAAPALFQFNIGRDRDKYQ